MAGQSEAAFQAAALGVGLAGAVLAATERRGEL